MDKKAKKRWEVLKKKLEQVQRQLAGAKQQLDDPREVERYESERQAIVTEMNQLQQNKT